MSKKRVINGISVEEAVGSVYSDLGFAESREVEIKARLVTEVAEIIKRRRLTQQQAAEILGLTQPKNLEIAQGPVSGRF